MQQRQPRVGDIVDDYCPRERRVSDHAVVAMVEDEIRQTRCTTCDTEHDYRQAKIPPGRKKSATVLPPKPPAGAVVAPKPPDLVDAPGEAARVAAPDPVPATHIPAAAASADRVALSPAHEGHVHRRLIRAVLPRIEGEVPVRPAPEFTMHRAGTRPPHGKPDRSGHGGQQRLGAKGGHGQSRHPGPRHDRGGSPGNTGGRGGQGASGGGPRHGRPPGGGRGPGNKH